MKIYDDQKKQGRFDRFVREIYKGSNAPSGLSEESGILSVYKMFIENTPPKTVRAPYTDPIHVIHAYCESKDRLKFTVLTLVACVACIVLGIYEPTSMSVASVLFLVLALLCSFNTSRYIDQRRVVNDGKESMKEFVELLHILGFKMNRYDQFGSITQYDKTETFSAIAKTFLERLACSWSYVRELNGRNNNSSWWSNQFIAYNQQLSRMRLVESNSSVESYVPEDGSFKTGNTVLPFT